MTLEQRVEKLERNYKNLNDSFLKSQRNNTNTVSRVDDNSNRVEQLTPYTETKTAYYGETEKVFYDVPEGNVTVFGLRDYNMERIADSIIFTFEPIVDQTDITISVS